MNKNQKASLIKKLLIAAAVLSGIYIISFTPILNPSDPKPVETALLNSKYNVNSFTIETGTSTRLEFSYNGEFWQGCSFIYGDELYFPCDTDVVEKFLLQSKTVTGLYTVEKNSNLKTKEELEEKLSDYSLDENHCLTITYYDENKNTVSQIMFGKQSQTGESIFIKTTKSNSVYKISSEISTYLNISPSFWADPHIIPKSIFKDLDGNNIQQFVFSYDSNTFYKATEKSKFDILSFRHGNILSQPQLKSECEFSFKIEDGTGSSCQIGFYPYQTNSTQYYEVEISVQPSFLWNDEAKEFFKRMNYTSQISKWTFTRIKELITQN